MKKLITLFLSVIIVALLSACESEKIELGDKNITIAQWGSEKYLIYLPVYIAQESGLFKKYGLNVKIEFSGNDDQVFAKVLRGDAQFGVGDPIFTAVSRQQGADGVVLASIVDRVALWGVSKSGTMIKSEAGFSEKRIGTFPRPSTTYTLLKDSIDKPNVSNTRILEVPIGNELSLLESNSADIVMLLEPAASIAESKGYHVVTSFPKIWGRFAFTGLTSTEEFVNSNPKLAKAAVDALEEAVKLAHDEPVKAIDIALKLFPNLDKTIVTNAVNRMLNDETLPKSVKIDKDSWVASVKVRQRVGDVKKGFDCMECIIP